MTAAPVRARSVAAKPARHRAILTLVRGSVIRTQEDLVAELHRRRFAVTQATVSRDIRELGLLRVHDDAGPRYMAPVAEVDADQSMHRLRNALQEHVLTIEFVDLLGVVHTAPGCAPLVGGALDGAGDGVVELPAQVGDRLGLDVLPARAVGRRVRAQLVGGEELARVVVDTLSGSIPETAIPTDERIARALQLVRDWLGDAIPLSKIAAAVRLSPDRFRHLFVQETGVSFRAYLLWQRLERSLIAYVGGETLTNAAHTGGFADSAHFSRTFRRMFGIAPASVRPE